MTLIALYYSEGWSPIFLSDLLVTQGGRGQSATTFSPVGNIGHSIEGFEQVSLAFKAEILDQNTCLAVSGPASACLELLDAAKGLASLPDFNKRFDFSKKFFQNYPDVEYIYLSVERLGGALSVLSNCKPRRLNGELAGDDILKQDQFSLIGGSGARIVSGDGLNPEIAEFYSMPEAKDPFCWAQVGVSRAIKAELSDPDFAKRRFGGQYCLTVFTTGGWQRVPVAFNRVFASEDELMLQYHSRVFVADDYCFVAEFSVASKGVIKPKYIGIQSINYDLRRVTDLPRVDQIFSQWRNLDVSVDLDQGLIRSHQPLFYGFELSKDGHGMTINWNDDAVAEVLQACLNAR